MIGIGIDCGSAACKGVMMKDGKIAGKHILPTGWNPKSTAQEILQKLLDENGVTRAEVSVIATGYGRVSIDFADRSVTEITCHALGADYLLPNVKTVIDIGGQDSKAISVENGKVISFQMNDKCAAGTGRFIETSAIRLGTNAAEFGTLLESGKSCSLNSMCAVFADSEIVSLLASGKSREEVAGGIVNSVAARAAALSARIGVRAPVLLTGGLSSLDGLRKALSTQLNTEVQTSPDSRYAGAIGAAILAANDVKRRINAGIRQSKSILTK